MTSAKKRPLKRDYRTQVALGGLILSFFVVFFWNDVVIPVHAGEQGVYWSRFFGGTRSWFIGEGSFLKLPWDEIAIYDMRYKAVSRTTTLLTVDGMNIEVQWTARYVLKSADLPELHRSFGLEYEQTLIVPEVVSALRLLIGNFRADKIYAEDEAALLGNIFALVQERFKSRPLTIEDVLITKLTLPQSMEEAIVEKLIQEQRLLSYSFRLQTETEEKERRTIEAEGLQTFEQISGISPLKWRGIDATVELAKSPNAKIILLGTDAKQLPLLLNTEPGKGP